MTKTRTAKSNGCIVTANAAGPCCLCGEYCMHSAHILGVKLHCALCCYKAGGGSESDWNWEKPVETLTGKQGGLF